MASDHDHFAYIYVLGIPGGPHKIGYSYRPEDRVRAMEREGRKGVYLCGQWPMGARVVQAAERYIHWLLRDKHLKNEWFNVSLEEAEDAVRKALYTTLAIESSSVRIGVVAHRPLPWAGEGVGRASFEAASSEIHSS